MVNVLREVISSVYIFDMLAEQSAGRGQGAEGHYSIRQNALPPSEGTSEIIRSSCSTWTDASVQGLLLIGAVFKSTVPDETDEERRQLERYAQPSCPL